MLIVYIMQFKCSIIFYVNVYVLASYMYKVIIKKEKGVNYV